MEGRRSFVAGEGVGEACEAIGRRLGRDRVCKGRRLGGIARILARIRGRRLLPFEGRFRRRRVGRSGGAGEGDGEADECRGRGTGSEELSVVASHWRNVSTLAWESPLGGSRTGRCLVASHPASNAEEDERTQEDGADCSSDCSSVQTHRVAGHRRAGRRSLGHCAVTWCSDSSCGRRCEPGRAGRRREGGEGVRARFDGEDGQGGDECRQRRSGSGPRHGDLSSRGVRRRDHTAVHEDGCCLDECRRFCDDGCGRYRRDGEIGCICRARTVSPMHSTTRRDHVLCATGTTATFPLDAAGFTTAAGAASGVTAAACWTAGASATGCACWTAAAGVTAAAAGDAAGVTAAGDAAAGVLATTAAGGV